MFMAVPMVDIGEVWVPMHKSLMPVRMAMRLAGRSVRPVRVLVMFVMPVPVLMLNFVMSVLMIMALRQMQPEAKRHHAARGD